MHGTRAATKQARCAPGPMERWFGTFMAGTILEGRRALDWTQRDLADRAGVSQSAVSRAERGIAANVSLDETARMLDALGIRLDASVRLPLRAGGPAQRDAVHAQLVAYTENRLRRFGLETAREVPIGSDRVRGWIDLLSWRSCDRHVFVTEVKGDVRDVGALERQVAWYEREAWGAARQLGWRPARVVVITVMLASRHNADLVRAHADALGRRFACPRAELASILEGAQAEPGTRSLAFIDPRRRHRSWLLPSPLSGGRPVLPYSSAADLRPAT
jgi:transcriptional regulator with XRE-family HTH domain